MHGMAQAVADLIEQGAPAFEAAVPILSQLLKWTCLGFVPVSFVASIALRRPERNRDRSRPHFSIGLRTAAISLKPAMIASASKQVRPQQSKTGRRLAAR